MIKAGNIDFPIHSILMYAPEKLIEKNGKFYLSFRSKKDAEAFFEDIKHYLFYEIDKEITIKKLRNYETYSME